MDKLTGIVRIIGVLVAIVGAFVAIPLLATILIIAGLISGLDVPQDRRSALMLATLVLTALSGELGAIPAVGGWLAAIGSNLGMAYLGASLTVIVTALAGRLKL